VEEEFSEVVASSASLTALLPFVQTLRWGAPREKRGEGMRRVVLVLAAMALALLLASGVALAVNKVGTNGPDTLRGTNGDDNLLGKGGSNDELFSLNGRDNLLGGAGKDCLICATRQRRGFAGEKNLVGGPGNDYVVAGKGSDNVVGGEGNDYLADPGEREFSKDNFSGGPGNDVIDVVHYRSARDLVVCGSGFDRVLVDSNDVVAPDCEKVVVFRGGTFSEYLDVVLIGFYEETVPPNFFESLPRCSLEFSGG
jgi:Ca2+-binding RTX toxin-like protein